MTRKCIICKETNYKNSYSFFSAPKDPETRKKWADAMGVENVNDDTFVCSKHFSQSDIITHWVSGVPPHVVTIKYKKCRLRPGAVPDANCESIYPVPNSQNEDYELEVNRTSGVVRRPSLVTSASSSRDAFTIPREDNVETIAAEIEEEEDESATCRTISQAEDTEPERRLEQDAFSEDTNNSSAQIMENPDPEQEMAEIVHIRNDAKFVYAASHAEGGTRIIYVSAETLQAMDEEEETVAEGGKCSSHKERRNVDDEDDSLPKSHVTSLDDDTSIDMWEALGTENLSRIYDTQRNEETETREKVRDSKRHDPLSVRPNYHSEAMLFEDLLDVYTEVQLPCGWSPIVASKGHATTVVYAFMAIAKSGVPYIEKQVFLRSDMKLRCGAADKEINPQIHNLVRDGRSRIVCSLADVEELVEEFHQRIVCEGYTSEKTRPDETAAYRDVSSKWRHIKCPIIVNNGSSRCSKCSTLDASSYRSKPRKRENNEHPSSKREKMRILHRSLRETEKNERLTLTGNNAVRKFGSLTSSETLMTFLENLDVPRIQKLMMKECLKASIHRNDKSKYSETWVFLCLLLYIESPRMYKYLLANKYMILPSLKIIRKYLHQIKTDKQFYNLFQRTVEPFQPSERDSEKEPT